MDSRALLAVALLISGMCACSTGRKLTELRTSAPSPSLSVADDVRPMGMSVRESVTRDTLKVRDDDGREMLIMEAVRDEDGEMVATDRIEAATVTALFKNVAERHGKVDLRFNITVPPTMTDSKWQLRLQPRLHMLGESGDLEPVVVTGLLYRKAQLRGYQQYERFLNSIVTDTSFFIRKHDLEVFLARNLPEVYAMRADTSFVSDENFRSLFGVTGKEASDHYSYKLLRFINDRKIASKERKFRQYVKVPIETGGLRLDTVMRNDAGEFVYQYVQTISTRPELRKAQITLAGSIFEEDRRIFRVPESDTLSFYISALSTLVDNRERYLSKVIERRVSENSACWIDFSSGSAVLEPSMGDNAAEMGRIRRNMTDLLENSKFDMDSIVVTASASPEGSYSSNAALSLRRSRAVCDYFSDFARAWKDSVEQSRGVMLTIGDEALKTDESPDIRFIPHSIPENWTMLDVLVASDSVLTDQDRADFSSVSGETDPDRREKLLSGRSYYGHLRNELYPKLRTVRFDFFLHRKGMTKDTVHTTMVDSLYMKGVQLIRDRDYGKALEILRPYADYNTAVAYSSMDYNASALSVLEPLERTPKVNYLLAILYSRTARDRDAVECYLRACAADPSLVHRGNLDPEISELVHRYGLADRIYENQQQ